MMGTNPNQGLIRHLIDNYYKGDINSQESDFVYSHWKYYSGLFNVELDSEGNLVALFGTGFGTYEWASPIHRLLDQLWKNIGMMICSFPWMDPTSWRFEHG